jgi:hypothetical protein
VTNPYVVSYAGVWTIVRSSSPSSSPKTSYSSVVVCATRGNWRGGVERESSICDGVGSVAATERISLSPLTVFCSIETGMPAVGNAGEYSVTEYVPCTVSVTVCERNDCQPRPAVFTNAVSYSCAISRVPPTPSSCVSVVTT